MSGITPRIQYLFNRYMQKTCTREELQELFSFIAQPENRQLLEQLMDEQYAILQPLASAQDIDWEHIYQQVTQTTDNTTIIPLYKKGRFRWLQVAAAAVIVLSLGFGSYWLINRFPKNKMAENDKSVNTVKDILPGGDKAVLTLADGRVIVLDSAQNGVITQQGMVNVIKNKNGQVSYKSAGRHEAGATTYNLLSTPRGGQYQLILPDGSKVWLNAASSIRYPVAFTGNERRIEITGEAYFEIEQVRNASGQRIPFAVDILPSTGGAGGGSRGAEIEVLGTHFNVNGYRDEEVINTTLMEGKVRMKSAGSLHTSAPRLPASVILQPGQQAQLLNNGNIKKIEDADIELAMAWKNGITAFKSADIKSIMRQVARWYNVDVVYEGEIPQRSFTGGIPRNANLSELLHLLEVSKVHFKQEGNKLTVMP